MARSRWCDPNISDRWWIFLHFAGWKVLICWGLGQSFLVIRRTVGARNDFRNEHGADQPRHGVKLCQTWSNLKISLKTGIYVTVMVPKMGVHL